MAAPHVAGVIALMLQKNPELTIDGIRNHLFQHTQTNEDEMGTLPNNSWGYGIVDAKAAIDAVPIADGVPTTPQPPDIQPVAIGSTSMTSGAASLSPNLLSQIEFDILQTSMGHHYAHLVQKHFDEVRTLVNTNQRVGAVWVRGGGPTIVRRLLQAIYTPDEPIPSVIEGKSVVENLRRFLAILHRYGSPALRADLDRHSDMLLQFEGLSYNQFLAQLH
jgi:hypothetical protein